MAKIITINGTIFSEHINKNVTEEEFTNAFIDFIESKGWLFGGTVSENDDDDE